MANVLGTLFSDIANAIRNKTGTTDKMSPKDFPIQINNIVVGGGGDGGVTEWKFASGETVSDGSGVLTITHGLGSIPDIIKVDAERSSSDTDAFWVMMAFSEAMGTALNKNFSLGLGRVQGFGGAVVLSQNGGVDSDVSNLFATINKANTQTFTLNVSNYVPIPEGRKVTWWAVSGIT